MRRWPYRRLFVSVYVVPKLGSKEAEDGLSKMTTMPNGIDVSHLPKAQDLDDVLDLLILHDLLVIGLTNIQGLTLEGEDSIEVTTHHTQTTDSQSLGGITYYMINDCC